jgi:murein DD-endopeptidase MepM/ murein hydrolase activator NlpD
MNIIILGKRHGQSKTIRLGNRQIVTWALFAVLIITMLLVGGFQLALKFNPNMQGDLIDHSLVKAWTGNLEQQKKELRSLREASHEQLDALTLKMGEMEARLYRLDALGVRLTEISKLKNGEFDFSSEPSMGGPVETEAMEPYSLNEFEFKLESLSQVMDDREQQLALMEQLLEQKNFASETFIAGRPITWGWMSSPYGYRSDPFTGKRAWHAGVDFAGKDGSDIIAVASGVVTWSGERYGYGNLVEINHGDGYATRYAHCKEILVPIGQVVEKGQVIAKMGSTGRSTGPHVHYEVLRKGKTLDPKKYIYRASR